MLSTLATQDLTDQLNQLVVPKQDANLWLYHGDVGLVLYYYYLSIYREDPRYLEQSLHLLEQQIGNAGEYLYNYKFAYGVPGLAWVIQFFINRGVLAEEDAAALMEIDDHIERALHYNFSDRLYDLFIGTIGKGMYYLERLEFALRQQDFHAVQKMHRILGDIVDNLQHTAVAHPDGGIYWLDHYTSGHETYRQGDPYVGIGLSHGMPSIINFLARCYRMDVKKISCRNLIRQATDWLQQREISTGHYPTKWYPDGELDDTYDLSWCYGVFSVAASFYIAGQVLQDPGRTARAIAIVDRATSLSVKEYDVHQEAGRKNIFFCHGTAGISYLFRKMYRVLGRPDWEQAADRWLEATRAAIRQYPEATLAEHQRPLLDGLAGVSLILMSKQSTALDTGWDRLFLLDLEQFA